jgi:hypothetical protein
MNMKLTRNTVDGRMLCGDDEDISI